MNLHLNEGGGFATRHFVSAMPVAVIGPGVKSRFFTTEDPIGHTIKLGSQWLSDPYQHKVREMIREGRLGKIVSISQSWNFNGPRWHVPNEPDILAIREKDTDWNRWLEFATPRYNITQIDWSAINLANFRSF